MWYGVGPALMREVSMDLAGSFAQVLKQRRKALDLTQEELAARVGCATVTIQRIEQGTRRPSRQIVQRLGDIFDLADDERERFTRLARTVFTAGDGTTEQQDEAAGSTMWAATPLPAQLTPLIGRAREVATACEL